MARYLLKCYASRAEVVRFGQGATPLTIKPPGYN